MKTIEESENYGIMLGSVEDNQEVEGFNGLSSNRTERVLSEQKHNNQVSNSVMIKHSQKTNTFLLRKY